MNVIEAMAAQMSGALTNVPRGRVLTMRYCSVQTPQQANVPAKKGPQPTMSGDGLEVRFRAPDGDVYQHIVPNGTWSPANPAAQFMALVGTPPSQFDGQSVDIREQDILIPLAVADGEYHIHQKAFEQGAQRLHDAPWMDTPSQDEDAENDADALSNDVVEVDVGNQGDE